MPERGFLGERWSPGPDGTGIDASGVLANGTIPDAAVPTGPIDTRIAAGVESWAIYESVGLIPTAKIRSADTTNPGLMSAADKTKLDAIECPQPDEHHAQRFGVPPQLRRCGTGQNISLAGSVLADTRSLDGRCGTAQPQPRGSILDILKT